MRRELKKWWSPPTSITGESSKLETSPVLKCHGPGVPLQQFSTSATGCEIHTTVCASFAATMAAWLSPLQVAPLILNILNRSKAREIQAFDWKEFDSVIFMGFVPTWDILWFCERLLHVHRKARSSLDVCSKQCIQQVEILLTKLHSCSRNPGNHTYGNVRMQDWKIRSFRISSFD